MSDLSDYRKMVERDSRKTAKRIAALEVELAECKESAFAEVRDEFRQTVKELQAENVRLKNTLEARELSSETILEYYKQNCDLKAENESLRKEAEVRQHVIDTAKQDYEWANKLCECPVCRAIATLEALQEGAKP